jgi:hypothetical protein
VSVAQCDGARGPQAPVGAGAVCAALEALTDGVVFCELLQAADPAEPGPFLLGGFAARRRRNIPAFQAGCLRLGVAREATLSASECALLPLGVHDRLSAAIVALRALLPPEVRATTRASHREALRANHSHTTKNI